MTIFVLAIAFRKETLYQYKYLLVCVNLEEISGAAVRARQPGTVMAFILDLHT